MGYWIQRWVNWITCDSVCNSCRTLKDGWIGSHTEIIVIWEMIHVARFVTEWRIDTCRSVCNSWSMIHDPCRSVCNSCRTQGFRPMGFNFLSQRVTNVALPDPQKKQSVAKYDDLPRKKHITDRCAFVAGHIWREQSCQRRFCKWWASALHNFQSKSTVIEILDSGPTTPSIQSQLELSWFVINLHLHHATPAFVLGVVWSAGVSEGLYQWLLKQQASQF